MANKMLARVLAAGATTILCAALLWLTGILLVTRQTGMLLLLMAATAAMAVCLAMHAKKKGRRALFAIAIICLALAAALGLLALDDIIEPEAFSCLEHTI